MTTMINHCNSNEFIGSSSLATAFTTQTSLQPPPNHANVAVQQELVVLSVFIANCPSDKDSRFQRFGCDNGLYAVVASECENGTSLNVVLKRDIFLHLCTMQKSITSLHQHSPTMTVSARPSEIHSPHKNHCRYITSDATQTKDTPNTTTCPA